MVFVTGGTGFLGAHLLYHIISKGEQVRALKRKNSNLDEVKRVFSYHNKENETDLFAKIEWLEGDLLDYNSILECLDGIRYVYHAGAIVSFQSDDKSKMIINNVQGTSNIVNASLETGVKKFCHVSSIAALGSAEPGELIDEKSERKSVSKNAGYSISKFHSELEVWRGIAEGLNAVIVNPSIILGSGFWEKGSSKIFHKVSDGLKFFTKGISGYVDVHDVCEIMIRLMKSEISGERFCLNSENLSFESILKKIAGKLKKEPPNIYANPFLTEIAWRLEFLKKLIFNKTPIISRQSAKSAHSKKYFSNKKIIELLDYNFIPIDNTIKEICKNYRMTES
ncbi:MAG: NAD-dependent epimerase/dehydratase family protein [Bacteroidetes bacterium]|jgi:dihydroflavonol-4-reductase|nr:NAD-dependent epimerase/dehydratase family protein [Bacteroidota bacterium]MBT6684693.1 NAD-dependent epimerase/dehydratase family protein [Bacteroidota bacterium]MBT7143182.1 NAD-dependent epimerase/dehydratase family protein [Bacteroidota bacterium]MBT7492625.1 NAD-dependent epimerase/dehydratase family protein [Bacteroidota bacterium]